MSKVDQLRALRDAKYARKNAQPQPAVSVPEAPSEPVKPAPKKAKAKNKAAAPKR
jgi:hypothetical protein